MLINNVKAQDFSHMTDTKQPAFDVLVSLFGEDLAVKQLQLEHEAYAEGERRFIKNLQRQQEHGELANNKSAAPLIDTLTVKVSQSLREYLESPQKAGRTPKAKTLLENVKPEVAAAIAIKVVVNKLAKEDYSHLVGTAYSIGSNIEDEIRFGRIRDQERAYFKAWIQPKLDERISLKNKRALMSVIESAMIEDKRIEGYDGWVSEDKVHVGIKLIEMLVSADVLETVRMFAGTKKDSENIRLTESFSELIKTRAFSLAGIAPVHQPCVVNPKPWDSVKGGGYWADGKKPVTFLKVYSKKALRRYEDVHMPQVYEAVNVIQDTAWKINKKVLDVVNEVMGWKSAVGGLPSLQGENKPLKPFDIDTNEVALKDYKKETTAFYRNEVTRKSKRLQTEFIVAQANKFSQFKKIFFPYNIDWRGRVYAIPSFNPQSNDLGKGLLTLANGKPIGKDGLYWLKVHGANCAGIDKVTFDKRINWIEDNEELILECAKSPLDCLWWSEQDSPYCFLAFCFEYAAVKQYGLKYVSSLPIAFDGSCSGIQHFSAMLRDRKGGKAVNLVPSDEVQDIYNLVAIEVNKVLEEDAVNGTEPFLETIRDKKEGLIDIQRLGTKRLAKQWLEYGVNRKVTKRSVMTLAYGSKEYGFRDQVMEDVILAAVSEGKGHMFTNPGQAAGYMAKLIWNAVSVTVVAAVDAMKWLQKSASLLAKTVKNHKKEVLRPCLPVHWVTPDGFPVWQEYVKFEQTRLDLMFLGKARMQLTVNTVPTNTIDTTAQRNGISPNFVHSMDGAHLRKTVLHANKAYGITSFAMIHDSFGTVAADAGNLFKAVRESMVDTYEHNDVLQDFYEQFVDQLHESQIKDMPAIPQKGDLDIREILNSKFAFA